MGPRGLNAIPLPYEVDSGHHRGIPAYARPSQLLPPFLQNLKQDDIILIILIVLLLLEGSECDFLLVGILVVIFLAGFDNKI